MKRFTGFLVYQALIALLLAAGLVLFAERYLALYALFGGLVSMVNASMLKWHRTRSDRMHGLDPGQSLRLIYRSALERYLVVGGLFAVAFGVLPVLGPFAGLALIGGFILGQIGLTVYLAGKRA